MSRALLVPPPCRFGELALTATRARPRLQWAAGMGYRLAYGRPRGTRRWPDREGSPQGRSRLVRCGAEKLLRPHTECVLVRLDGLRVASLPFQRSGQHRTRGGMLRAQTYRGGKIANCFVETGGIDVEQIGAAQGHGDPEIARVESAARFEDFQSTLLAIEHEEGVGQEQTTAGRCQDGFGSLRRTPGTSLLLLRRARRPQTPARPTLVSPEPVFPRRLTPPPDGDAKRYPCG